MTAVLLFYCFELTLIPVQIWFKYWVSNNWKNYFEFLLVDFTFSHHMLNRNQSQEYGSSVFSLNCQTFFKIFTTLQWNTKLCRRRGWSSMWFFLPYTRCITPNLVTSWRCPISALLHLQATQLLSQKCGSDRELPAIRATENFFRR